MRLFLIELMTWIAMQTGLVAVEPPNIVFVSHDRLVEKAYGDSVSEDPTVAALYDRESMGIFLPDDWDKDDMFQLSALVHELVHHMQLLNNVRPPCSYALEAEAYSVQAKWLKQKGVPDPYRLMGVDAFSILVRSMCTQSE